ncbi:MAG: hypothetical protein AB9873_18135 [Syntrophobacteraceae bacterium]
MGVLFYAAAGNGFGAKVYQSLVHAVTREGVETFADLDSFSTRLCAFPSCMSIVVLLAATREDLAELRSIKHLLEDTRILLVLPDGDPETVRMAHELTPRFLTYLDGDFSDLSAVLKKMTGQG